MGEVLVDDDALDEHAVLHAASDLRLNLREKSAPVLGSVISRPLEK